MTRGYAPRLAVLVAALVVACSTTPRPTGSPAVSGSPSEAPDASGSAASTAPTIANLPPCEIVFQAEAAKSIGVSIEFAHGTEQTAFDGQGSLAECVYWRHVYQDFAPMDLTLGIGDSYVARFHELQADPDATPKSSLGDEAFLRLSTVTGLDGPVGALFVKMGKAILGLSLGIVDITDDGELMLAGDREKQSQILVELAGLAVQRLTSPQVASAKTCDLASLADMATAVGVSLTAAQDVDAHDEWGSACHYMSSDTAIELFVSLASGSAALAHFDACKSNSELVVGLGDEAIAPRDCYPKVGLDLFNEPIIVRSGDTILTIGRRLGGALDTNDWRVTRLAVARLTLQGLGVAPGATSPPVAPDALVHPCALISNDEVAGIVGVAIESNAEWSANAYGTNAECYYSTANASIAPFNFRLGAGTAAVQVWNSYRTYLSQGFKPVAGVGDEALTKTEGETQADQPYVALYIRRGDVVLELHMGPVKQSADFQSYIAAGTPDAQMAMLRKLADVILPRLFR